jgi:glycosyltransferase involved in cell wall biosynthesis
MQTIAVNARFLLPGRLEGIGYFSQEVLRRWVQAHPEVQFHCFFDRPYDARFLFGPNVTPHVLLPPARHPLLFIAWFEAAVAWQLRRLRPDAFYSPDGYLSLSAPRTIPQVPVMHDLAFEHYPQDMGPLMRWHYHRYFPRFAHRAARIQTVSAFSRQDIATTYQVPPAQIDVVYNGSREGFCPLAEADQQAVRAQYTAGEEYFLYVGAIQPRKNLVNLLKAFDRYKATTGRPTRLVLTGRPAWQRTAIEATFREMQHREAVIFTGYVAEAELARLYAAALALAYVSRLEGFGLPLLEAMHAETALITSNVSSLPEVAGEAALYADPLDPAAIAAALQRIDADRALRARLIAAGRHQRTHFSWTRTAEAAWASLAEAVPG